MTAVPTFAQTGGLRTKPIDFDNTIVLTLPDEGQAVWKRAGRLLAQRGYPVRFASPELLTLSTEPVGSYTQRLMGITFVVEGHELRLQGYYPSGENGASWLSVMEYTNGQGIRGRSWKELEEVAKLLGGTVHYTRAPTH
ncbi:hypothetical protein [Hymenobacter terrestris]|uniref:Uncharacterized protein n=1 Tax=Hymenobacter terrestris TaxID=2748310 RepID=A0ABX2Q3D7_9BACT|nr:hypothetical protein [Hymenobacter terrestris]NVO85059.1 hypothetical protein [Hymenobacter terrestris]